MRTQSRTNRTSVAVAIGAALAISTASTVPVAGQDEASTDGATEGQVIGVSGTEYAFTGLPTSVPVGTTLTFTNDGGEIHELVLNRVADGVTETFDELMALDASGVDLEAEGYIDTAFGFQQLFAVPGQTADGALTLGQEGRYVALCYIPSGLEVAKLEELGIDIDVLGPDTDPTTLSPEAQAFIEEVMANPPHLALGMIQEFVVSDAGSEPGLVPAESASE